MKRCSISLDRATGWRSYVVALVLTALVSVAAASGSAADEVLAGASYFQAVRMAISNAVLSIDIQMYFIIANPGDRYDPVSTLIDELIKAHKRGVKVRVVLEDSKFKENQYAYTLLACNGIDVRFDTPRSLLHSKVVVVDRRICIVGSANWSRAAFIDNYEVSVLIDSEDRAREILESFTRIQLSDHPPALPRKTEGAAIPASFMSADGAAAQLVKDRADYAFELYLLLLKMARESGSPTVQFDTGAIREQLGCRNVRRPRLRLEKRYGVIAYDAKRKDVTLKGIDEKESCFVLPYEYWDFGLGRRLSLRARHMYLVGLVEASKSTRAPYWFRSQADLGRLYGISEYTISLGLQELERENIIEIERFEPLKQPPSSRGYGEPRGAHAERKANVYCMNALVSEEEFEKSIVRLVKEYGDETMGRARKLSEQLNEPRDAADIEVFVGLIREYGYDVVRKMNEITAGMKRGGGRRDVGNTVRLLQATEVGGN